MLSKTLFRKFTSQAYNIQRGVYAKLTPPDIDYFRKVLQPKDVITNNEDLQPCNVDWMQKYKGQSKLLLKPRTTSQVSDILKWCNDRHLAVVPQGGNTGLVGGSVPVFDEIVISTSNMNKILEFNDVSGAVTVEAGTVLQTLDEWLKDRGYMFPIDLGAKGSCQIGGNVATNAGGLRLLRYGNLHGLVLGIEAVLPNGDVFNNLTTIRKDNTGFDLKQLFIGSEGSIGIITKVAILCPPKPQAVNVAWLGLDNFTNVEKCFKLSKTMLNEILSSFECVDTESMRLVEKHTKMTPPLESGFKYQVLIETNGSNTEHDEEKLNSFVEQCLEQEIVEDGVIAESQDQINTLWQWREGISEVSGKLGGVYKYDVSLPLANMWELVCEVKKRLEPLTSKTDESKPVYSVIGYGHIGDGNLHLNIPTRCYSKEIEDLLEPFVFEFVQKHEGSISAEHGLGFQKAHALHYSKPAESIVIMKRIKSLLDPRGIMNPYKFIL